MIQGTHSNIRSFNYKIMLQHRIYVTHCTAKKDDSFKGTQIAVTPNILYTGLRIQAFMKRCMALKVEWAILSDNYGVIKPYEEIKWYEKHPDKVTKLEKRRLLRSFVYRLSGYDEIFFYHNPPRFHHLYQEIIEAARKNMPGTKIIMISKISQIRPNPYF